MALYELSDLGTAGYLVSCKVFQERLFLGQRQGPPEYSIRHAERKAKGGDGEADRPIPEIGQKHGM